MAATPVAGGDRLERDYRSPEYEHPIDDVNWSSGVGQPAGVYWLDGTTIIAAYDSVAEKQLQARGAVLVATLRFDSDPIERVHGADCLKRVQRVAAVHAAHELLVSCVN